MRLIERTLCKYLLILEVILKISDESIPVVKEVKNNIFRYRHIYLRLRTYYQLKSRHPYRSIFISEL